MKTPTTGQPEKAAPKRKSVAAMNLPTIDAAEKVLKRSHQRSGVVAGGTLISSGNRQATVAFPAKEFHVLKLAAAKNGVSLSEMIRQLVHRGLAPTD